MGRTVLWILLTLLGAAQVKNDLNSLFTGDKESEEHGFVEKLEGNTAEPQVFRSLEEQVFRSLEQVFRSLEEQKYYP